MKKLQYKIRKFKNKFLRNYFKIEAKIKYPLLLFFYKLGLFGEIVLLASLLLVFLNLIGVFKFSMLENFMDLIDLKDEQLAKQIIFSQVSLSFLILSLLSFLTNLKKDKVLGTSIYRIVFTYSILGNLALLSLIIFGCLFINIIMYFYEPTSIIIPYVFMIVMGLLSMYILKIIIYTNNQKKCINKISTLYYTKNLQIVKHNHIEYFKSYETPQIIFELVEDTERKIRNNDIEYSVNFQVYAQLSNLTLMNLGKKVQENYIERYRKKEDIITFWIRQTGVLLDCNLLDEAIEQFNKLLNILVRNEVYLAVYEITQLLERILVQIKSITNVSLFKNFEDKIFKSMELTIRYSYFKLNNDFSYTRLGQYKKSNLIYLTPMTGNFYKEYYQIIWDNKFFSELEKRKLTYDMIERIRMLAFEIDSPFNNDYFNLNDHYYNVIKSEKDKLDGDLELIGIPLSVLLYEVILRKDTIAVYHLLFQYNMNSIYYSCLVVISKLITQYTKIGKEDKYLTELIKLLSIKLEQFDSYKLKQNKMKIIQSETIDQVYSTLLFLEVDKSSIELLYQSIEMKRHQVDYTVVKNKKLKKICEIVFNDENKLSLIKKWSKNREDISSLFFPLVK